MTEKASHTPLADAQGIVFGATMAATGVLILTSLVPLPGVRAASSAASARAFSRSARA